MCCGLMLFCACIRVCMQVKASGSGSSGSGSNSSSNKASSPYDDQVIGPFRLASTCVFFFSMCMHVYLNLAPSWDSGKRLALRLLKRLAGAWDTCLCVANLLSLVGIDIVGGEGSRNQLEIYTWNALYSLQLVHWHKLSDLEAHNFYMLSRSGKMYLLATAC
jgi:hypothetical protein